MISPYQKPVKWESAKYRRFIAEQPCFKCTRPGPNDPHHEGSDSGMATKASDVYLIPLCRSCHNERGDDGFTTFWMKKFELCEIALAIRDAQLRWLNVFLKTQTLRSK